MPGPDQLHEGLARVAATSDESLLPGTDAVRGRGEQRTRRRRAVAAAAAACVLAGGALGTTLVLGGDPRTVPAAPPVVTSGATPTPTTSPPGTTDPPTTSPPTTAPTTAPPSSTSPPATSTPAAQWPEVLTQLDPGTTVWLVLLAVSPDPDDPVFPAVAQRWPELTPYPDDRFERANTDLGAIQEEAAADADVVAACPAISEGGGGCLASSVPFATEAEAERFVELYADPTYGPFAWDTGSLD